MLLLIYIAFYRICVCTYVSDAGKAFGELALLNEDSVRNASIIADEETDLLIINRDLFNRSLKVGSNNSTISPLSMQLILYQCLK